MAGDLDTAIQAASQAYGIPAPILYGHAMAESGGNPDIGNSKIAPAIGNDTHTGAFQISGDMARRYGGDPNDVNQAAMMAARALHENYLHFGNLDDASKAFHGGLNPANWKSRTDQNYNSVIKYANAYSNRSQGTPTTSSASATNQFDDAFTAGTNAAPKAAPIDSTNPYDVAFSGGNSAPDASVRPNYARQVPRGTGAANGGNGGNGVQNAPIRGNGGTGTQGDSGGQGGNAGGPSPSALDYFGSVTRNAANGWTAGLADQVSAGVDAVIPVDALIGKPVQSIWGGKSLGEAFGHNLALEHAEDAQTRQAMPWTSFGADLAGGVLSPLSKVGAPTEGASALANALRMAAGGATYGAVRGGSETGTLAGAAATSLIGGIAAPALGVPLGIVAGKVAPKISALADAIKGAVGKSNAPALAIPETGAQAGQRIAAMIKSGEPDSVIQDYAAQHGFGDGVNDALAFRARNGRYTPGVVLNKAPITEAQARDATGSRGGRTGIESNPGLTPDVQARTDQLRSQGVPDDQALRQAHIESAGASPTAADVTRDPMLVRQTKEGAKLDTPEGLALSQRAAQNNAAIDSSIRDVVNANGGAPVAGQAMETAANSLAKASDAERKGVDLAYSKARDQDGEVRVDPTELRAVLTDPINRAAVTTEGSAFIKGMSGRQNILNPTTEEPARSGLGGFWDRLTGKTRSASSKGLTMDELEQLRQSANSAYDPTGQAGERNGLISKVKTAIDTAQDRIGETGPGYQAARGAYRSWAAKYDDPAGIASLIARDTKGNFANADNWRATDGLITTASDKHFVQIANQLKANGDTTALGSLKAHVVQKAYEAATGKAAGTAVDQLGNSVVRGSQFHNNLNQVGKAKLDALFSPAEQSHLAALGHAASHVNEAVPGTVNTSNTAATAANLAQAISKASSASERSSKATNGFGLGHAMMGAMGMGELGHLGGHELAAAIAGAGAGIGRRLAEPGLAARASSKAEAELANALRGAASPDVARKVEEDHVKKLAQALMARSRVGGLAGRSGAVVSDRQRAQVH